MFPLPFTLERDMVDEDSGPILTRIPLESRTSILKLAQLVLTPHDGGEMKTMLAADPCGVYPS
jgi:hypothetical protein